MKLPKLTINYQNDAAVIIEGFGPETIIGAVSDVLKGNYREAIEGGPEVVSIEIQLP